MHLSRGHSRPTVNQTKNDWYLNKIQLQSIYKRLFVSWPNIWLWHSKFTICWLPNIPFLAYPWHESVSWTCLDASGTSSFWKLMWRPFDWSLFMDTQVGTGDGGLSWRTCLSHKIAPMIYYRGIYTQNIHGKHNFLFLYGYSNSAIELNWPEF